MPGQDRTGPLGQGPMTGRGFGTCGQGLGFRRGFGLRRFASDTEELNLTKSQEAKILETELARIEAEKNQVEKKLKELKA